MTQKFLLSPDLLFQSTEETVGLVSRDATERMRPTDTHMGFPNTISGLVESRFIGYRPPEFFN